MLGRKQGKSVRGRCIYVDHRPLWPVCGTQAVNDVWGALYIRAFEALSGAVQRACERPEGER